MGGTNKAINFENYDANVLDMIELLKESRILLYKGCNSNWQVAILFLLNCFAMFGVSTAFANEMLKLMKEVLPRENVLLKSYFEVQKYMAKMASSYNFVHACKNGCCLFCKELKDAKKCLKCDELQFTFKNSLRPLKVLQHFLFIPCLKWMLKCTHLVELYKWNSKRKKEENNIKCVSDSKAWKHIESLYLDFASKAKNIRLGMALDGINPFSN